MQINFKVNLDGWQRSFTLLATQAKQLNKPLREFDHYLRGRVDERFAAGGPGWEPLKKATQDEWISRARAIVGRKLRYEIKKAYRRFEGKFGRSAIQIGTESQRASMLRTISRRAITSQEFQKFHLGIDKITSEAFMNHEGTPFSLKQAEKQVASIKERVARAEDKAKSRPILGRIRKAFESKIDSGMLKIVNKVGFSGVHNDGGTAGHGAKIPERRFLFLEPQDIDHLAEILQQHMLLAFYG